MKKFFLCAVVALVFGFYVWQTRAPSSRVVDFSPVVLPSPPVHTPSPPAVPTGKYRDGIYTGSVADAFFGNIQVAAVVRSGRITSVNILEYPNDREHSIRLNSDALPRLISQAVRNQDAQVNIVSGATDSSLAFRASLSSALAQAKN